VISLEGEIEWPETTSMRNLFKTTATAFPDIVWIRFPPPGRSARAHIAHDPHCHPQFVGRDLIRRALIEQGQISSR
jgi:hypothetical protein